MPREFLVGVESRAGGGRNIEMKKVSLQTARKIWHAPSSSFVAVEAQVSEQWERGRINHLQNQAASVSRGGYSVAAAVGGGKRCKV